MKNLSKATVIASWTGIILYMGSANVGRSHNRLSLAGPIPRMNPTDMLMDLDRAFSLICGTKYSTINVHSRECPQKQSDNVQNCLNVERKLYSSMPNYGVVLE